MIQKSINLMLVLLLAVPWNVLAGSVQVKLGRGMVLRSDSGAGNPLVQSGYLQKGTVVEVDEEYAVRNGAGKIDSDATLNAWLSRAGELRSFEKKNSATGKTEIRRDYYFPIKVIRTPNGVDIRNQNTTGFVALQYLGKTGQAKIGMPNLVAVQPLPLFSASEGTPEKEDLGETPVPCKTSEHAPKALSFLASLEKTLAEVDAIKDKALRDKAGKLKSLKGSYNCGAISKEEMTNYLSKKATEAGIPPELLLGIMTRESGGNCFAVNEESGGSRSIGLFQINNKSKASDISEKCPVSNRTKTLQELEAEARDSIRCLTNPVVNISEGIRLLKKKYSMVNSKRTPPAGKQWSELSPQERDYWRKTLAAYNGGQGYVYQTYWDISDYNKTEEVKTGTNPNLDPDNWEIRRLFFFRNVLEKNGVNFIRKKRYSRSHENEKGNLAFTEIIAGRENDHKKGSSYIEQWAKILYK